MNDIFCSAKNMKVIEVTLKRELEGRKGIKLFGTQNEFVQNAEFGVLHCIIKQYYDEDGNLLAERNVTTDSLNSIVEQHRNK